MTEQSKPGGDASQQKTPWWVDQASEIIAPRGPLPAKEGPAHSKGPAVAKPAQNPPTQESTRTPREPQAEETPANERAPREEKPAAEAREEQTEEEETVQFEAPQEDGAQWDRALRDLDESCGQVQMLVRSLHELHADDSEAAGSGALRSLEGPIGKLGEAVRELSELGSPEESASDPEQGERAPALRGFTSSLPISSILELLSASRKSGTLCVTSEGEHFTLEILEGDVVHASSDRSTREQLLGSILVARDKIGVEQLEDFYRRYTQTSEVDDSEHETLVSREDLMSALEEQVQELFNRLYSAGNGVFCFYEGGRSNVEQRIRMNVTKLLLESARTQDELERRPEPDQPRDSEQY